MAMMRTTTPGSLTGSLSASGTMSANITVGTVNMTAADMTNYYDKEEVDGLLEGKADVDHTHTEYVTNSLYSSNLTIMSTHITRLDNADAEINTKLDTKADITYVDDAINTALGNIESELDEIIGEEV